MHMEYLALEWVPTEWQILVMVNFHTILWLMTNKASAQNRRTSKTTSSVTRQTAISTQKSSIYIYIYIWIHNISVYTSLFILFNGDMWPHENLRKYKSLALSSIIHNELRKQRCTGTVSHLPPPYPIPTEQLSSACIFCTYPPGLAYFCTYRPVVF